MRHLTVLLSLILALPLTTLAAPEADSTDVKLAALGTQFMVHLEKGEYEAAAKMFDAKVAEALPPDKLAQVWTSLPAQVGKYQGRGEARIERIEGYGRVLFDCRFEKMPLVASVVLDNEGKIAGFGFRAPEKK